MADLFRPRWREGNDPFRRLVVQTTLRFVEVEAAGGIVLVIAAVIAMAWANLDFHSYDSFWHTHVKLDLAIWSFDQSLQHVVNDVLMVVFFLVVGSEIKREVTHGELRSPRQAALPIFAALGGMLVPAAVYAALNAGGEGGSGWGIPVATDIAFALGVLALVGKGVPVQLKVFLLTLAVADDVGGILIIAIFYSESIQIEWLLGMVGAVAFLMLLKQFGFRHIGIHAIGGIFLWLTLWEAGVHATLAGVILGLIVPADALYDREGTSRRIDYLLQRLRYVQEDPDLGVREHDSHEALRNIEHVAREGMSPLEHLEEAMAPISAFVVVPLFALANAGIHITGDSINAALSSNIAWGIFLGLLLGKFVGIVAASALAIRLGIAFKPEQVRWSHLAGASLLAGIGFTVAIFIANLSFEAGQTDLLEGAKIGIFAASIIAAVLGFAVLRRASPRF
jgi:NhaA family Na+:H+ antiporter